MYSRQYYVTTIMVALLLYSAENEIFFLSFKEIME